MKNTLNEILSMMSKIDPSYVSEERNTEEKMGTIGFKVGDVVFFDGIDIANTQYSDEAFPVIAELINTLNNGNADSLKESFSNYPWGNVTKNSSYYGTLLYVIKYVVWGIIGNLSNRQQKMNESVVFETGKDDSFFDLTKYNPEDVQFSTGVNNYKEMLKIYLSSFMVELLIDMHNGEEISDSENYQKFVRGIDEMFDLAGKNEKVVLYLLVTRYIKQSNAFKMFEQVINGIKDESNNHNKDQQNINIFLKTQWEDFVGYVNDYLNGRQAANDSITTSPQLNSVEIQRIKVAISSCLKTGNKALGIGDNKGLMENLDFMLASFSGCVNNGAIMPSPLKTLQPKLLKLSSLGYMKVLSNVPKYFNTIGDNKNADLFNRLINDFNNAINNIEDFSSNPSIETHKKDVDSFNAVKNEISNILSQISGDITNILQKIDSFGAATESPVIKIDNKTKDEITLFDLMTDDDFYILNRWVLGNLYGKIKSLSDIDYNSIKYATANMSMSSRIYQGQLRYIFPEEKFGRLRAYLYYISNFQNYSKNLRSFLYGDQVFSESDMNDSESASNRPFFGFDDPCSRDTRTNEEVFREITELFINRLSGFSPEEQRNVIKEIRNWLTGIKLYGKSGLNSASFYDHIQDTLCYIVRNGNMQDKIRAAYMLDRNGRDFMRSFELLFSERTNDYDIVKQIPPLEILRHRSFNELLKNGDTDAISNIFGVSEKELVKSVPNNGLYVYDENGNIKEDASILDFFAGSHKSFDPEDKDKTNASIYLFCNTIAAEYINEIYPTHEVNESSFDDFEKENKYNELKFEREINKNGNDKNLKNTLGKLSIDVGNRKYKIAIEYQGEQHFVAEGRTSPISEKVRSDEFQDDTKYEYDEVLGKGLVHYSNTRYEVYEKRRNDYINYVINGKIKNNTTLNKLSLDFFHTIVNEFIGRINSGHFTDKYGIPINETIESIKFWLEDKSKAERIKEKEKANTLCRWKMEIDSWHQQLKDNAKKKKLCEPNNNDEPYDSSWLFIQLVPRKYKECITIRSKDELKIRGENVCDIISKYARVIQGNNIINGNLKEYEDAKRLLTRFLVWENYYGGNGLKYYGITTNDTGKNKHFETGDFKRGKFATRFDGSKTNYYVMAWPEDDTRQSLEQIIKQRYREKDKIFTELENNTVVGETIFESIIKSLLKDIT